MTAFTYFGLGFVCCSYLVVIILLLSNRRERCDEDRRPVILETTAHPRIPSETRPAEEGEIGPDQI